MGGFLSSIDGQPFDQSQAKVLMTGLDGSGKSTILYQLLGHRYCGSKQNSLYHRKLVKYQDVNVAIWDFEGWFRPMWRNFFESTVQGMIFVVDSADPGRIEEAKGMLHNDILNEHVHKGNEIKKRPLLVFANRQDYLPRAMTLDEVTEKLGLHEIKGTRWHIQPCCAVTGEGLTEGLHWLAQNRTVISPM